MPVRPDAPKKSYAEAREAFLQEAERAGASLGSHALAIRGGRGEELAIDLARLGPAEPDRLLVVSSGTHGIEGHAGSAIQRHLLREAEALELPSDLGLLLVHAVNPWGFDQGRRVNESNVDLNRNFLRHPEDHDSPEEYGALHPHINPDRLDAQCDEEARNALIAFAKAHGRERLQEVLSLGQHEHPTGLQYGGVEPEASNRLLREIAKTECHGASRIAWIDIHTGLGPWAVPELITELEPEDPIYLRGRAWYGDAFRSTRAGESVSAPLCGVIETGLTEAIDPKAEFTPFTAEFGTFPADRVFWALRADNWLHHHGDLDSERGEAIRAELLEVFRPSDPAWLQLLRERGFELVREARDGLVQSGATPGS